MVKIAIDCRMINKSGIGVYLSNILMYWMNNTNLSLCLIGDKYELKKLPLNTNCKIIDCKLPIFSAVEMISFPVKEVNACDIYYSPNFNIPIGIKIPIYLTIHDLVFLDNKESVSAIGRFLRYVTVLRAYKKAEAIFTVSNFSKSRLQFYFGNKKKIIISYNGIRKDLVELNSDKLPNKYNFDYFIFVGNIKKHKGIDILLKAIENTDFKIVIVGSTQNLKTSDKIINQKIRLNKNVIVEGRVDDFKLYSLIANAKALIQPSRYEGFGIPPLESMYLGTPAIISDINVFKEIYSQLPVTFFQDGNSDHLKTKFYLQIYPQIDKKRIEELYNYETTAKIILEEILKFNI